MTKKTIRIIICDDHEMVRRSLNNLFLSAPGYEIAALCESGEEVIRKTLEINADILLLDINMPAPDGFEVAKLLQDSGSATRIIAVSVSNSPQYCKRMIELGALGYITKTSPPEEFFKGIRQVMKGKLFLCQEIREALR